MTVIPMTTPSVPAAGQAPWWGVPVIAGTFLLVGAVIALVSTAASDRRKMAREDRRQWDKEIRDCYVVIAHHVERIQHFRFLVIPAAEAPARYEAGAAALGEIRAQADLLSIIGTSDLNHRVAGVIDACSTIVSTWHDLIHPRKQAFRDLAAAQGELLNTVKSEIRVDRYRPFVRPGMSRTARLRTAAAVRLRSLGRAVRFK